MNDFCIQKYIIFFPMLTIRPNRHEIFNFYAIQIMDSGREITALPSFFLPNLLLVSIQRYKPFLSSEFGFQN